MKPQLLTAWAGHWTGDGTGVTVILPPPGTVGSGEVRGGAPATREFALLDPIRTVDRVDAVVLSGGSAFGLSAADGVMEVLRARGLGFPTPLGPVPIVVGMSIFDASVAATPPTASAGRDAALAAFRGDTFTSGTVGAGAGATSGKWRGGVAPGGLGVAHGRCGDASIAVVAVANPWGDVIGADGSPLFVTGGGGEPVSDPFGMTNTTIAVVLTDAALTKTECQLLAQSGHTGFARALYPAHSRFDGDAVVALSTGDLTADLDMLRVVAADVTAAAIRAAADR
ncbi:putative S58-family peptidase [Actinoplanes missouriensis 431]|uniref:Putative S58-family peptidase n=1 Tax=Actinoplanes missouriensis (strain ATCC 14538 / DSM 43046 / CBS 188.64 / JCM 3121 / NBRC 102363 / NCIMB 12654 / NRRL B-3342 / UNCC 431) TaxID=512565 RepID=I0H7M2_ACTM4|nr:P1 family peptidase [Actinoplanes missouriensis]BAL89009.1 putative S58-family peptidase [Actinoplanes missouriensis 431]